jgi:hypothetical protein
MTLSDDTTDAAALTQNISTPSPPNYSTSDGFMVIDEPTTAVVDITGGASFDSNTSGTMFAAPAAVYPSTKSD